MSKVFRARGYLSGFDVCDLQAERPPHRKETSHAPVDRAPFLREQELV